MFSFLLSQAPSPAEIYTLSLHDALPISTQERRQPRFWQQPRAEDAPAAVPFAVRQLLRFLKEIGRSLEDRKSTRLNSSHTVISYAVFCLKKKTISGEGTTRISCAQYAWP